MTKRWCNSRALRELKQRRPRRQRERQKSNRLKLAKQQLCTCITLFCKFLYRHCTSTTWKYHISRFVEDVNTRRLWYSNNNSNNNNNFITFHGWLFKVIPSTLWIKLLEKYKTFKDKTIKLSIYSQDFNKKIISVTKKKSHISNPVLRIDCLLRRL